MIELTDALDVDRLGNILSCSNANDVCVLIWTLVNTSNSSNSIGVKQVPKQTEPKQVACPTGGTVLHSRSTLACISDKNVTKKFTRHSA